MLNVRITGAPAHILSCLDLSIDAMDVSGEQQFDVMHNIVKQRLSPDGSVVQEKELESKQSVCVYVCMCCVSLPLSCIYHVCVCVGVCVVFGWVWVGVCGVVMYVVCYVCLHSVML